MSDGEMVDAAARLLKGLSKFDFEPFEALLHRDIVMEWPYAAVGMPKLIRGKSAVLEALEKIPQMFESFEMTVDRFPGESTRTLTIEAHSNGCYRDGDTYSNNYVVLLGFERGSVNMWREYYDPRRVP